MAANSNALELFKRAIGAKITELTGLNDVYYERCRDAVYPRIIYTTTVWISNDTLKGTLSCTIAGNGAASEVDSLQQLLLTELDGFSSCSDDLMYYLHSGRGTPVEETDKTVRRRLVTFDFDVMGG